MDSRLSRRGFLRAVGVSAAGLAGCTAGYRAGSIDVTEGLEPTRTSPETLENAPLSATWTRELPGQFTLSTPGIDDDRLYVGSDTKMSAIALADGELDWQVEMGGATHGFTAAIGDRTVVGSARDIVGRRNIIDRGGTASLRALDAATGDEQWREPLAVSASPVVAGGTVFVPLVDGEETAVTAQLWGPGSFNDGAGMGRIYTSSAFIREAMPYGSPHSVSNWRDVQDIAGFMNGHDRPEFPEKSQDFPDGVPKEGVYYERNQENLGYEMNPMQKKLMLAGIPTETQKLNESHIPEDVDRYDQPLRDTEVENDDE